MKYSVEIHEALDNIYYVDVEAPSEGDAVRDATDLVMDGKVEPIRTIKIGYEYGSVEEAA